MQPKITDEQRKIITDSLNESIKDIANFGMSDGEYEVAMEAVNHLRDNLTQALGINV